jgi:ribosomal protein L37E
VGEESWRVEADDEWLSAHKSENFAKFRRKLARLGLLGLGDAASGAASGLLGPMAGAPRRPQLKIGGKAYAVVRYAEHRISYTTIVLDVQRCRRCGQRLVHVHRIETIHEDGTRRVVGAVRMCRRCKANSWLFFSRMPTVTRARAVARKVVL